MEKSENFTTEGDFELLKNNVGSLEKKNVPLKVLWRLGTFCTRGIIVKSNDFHTRIYANLQGLQA